MSKARLISTLTTGLAALLVACWLVTGAFPLTAQPQTVNDAAGVTVNLNGSTVLHRSPVHYPAPALRRGVQGDVSVEVKLDTSGNVSDARVLSGPDELRSAVLQSVLDWHFTRDAAGGTRVVEVAFELPKAGVIGGVPGGVNGRILGGVISGVPGGVVAGVPSAGPDNTQARPSFHIASIQANGLSDESRAALLASLPVHEGDELTGNAMLRLNQAVKAFDEHLAVAATTSGDGVTLHIVQIVDPGALPQARMSTEGTIPPPPPPPLVGAENAPQKIKVGGNVQSVMIVNKVPPIYPEMAKAARVEGVVRLAALIDKDGTVKELRSLEGPSLLIQAAMDAVKQWTYKPTLLNGEPVNVETTIDINFTLAK